MSTDLEPADDAPERGLAGKLFALAGVALGGLYLLNPGSGIFELIPDNLPLVGNLDEAAAVGLLIYGFKTLRRKTKRSLP